MSDTSGSNHLSGGKPTPLIGEKPLAEVTIQRFADGTFTAHAPYGDGQLMGLSNGDLAGALRFARERLMAE
jgi:hypothetical protein